MSANHAALDSTIAALGIEYRAEFVPQRLSRSAGETRKSLNWRITLTRKEGRARPLVTDYMQGIGHVPDIAAWHGFDRREIEGQAAECGTYRPKGRRFGRQSVPPPALRDVLYSLVLDAEALDMSFDDWCETFGYDTDSRKAEATYRMCCELGHQLAAIIGHPAISQLREAFQDY